MLVFNAFLLLAVNVLMEYNDLANRFQQVENTISTAVESAVDMSMASEEMFSSKFSEFVYSQSGSLNAGRELNTASQLRVFRRSGGGGSGEWISGNTYIMSFFFEDNGRFPISQYEYDNYASNFNQIWSVYERLFGEAGECYTNGSLSWSSNNRNTEKLLQDVLPVSKMNRSRLTATDTFKDFYQNIGYKVRTTAPVKVKNGDSFKVVEKEFPTLAQMGLDLGVDKISGENYNLSSSNTVTDNFCMSVHAGKRESASGYVVSKSAYFLTPYSLGVTYIPKNIVKPSFLANLEQIIRFSKIKTGDVQDASFAEDLSIADGCMESTVYDNSVQPRAHSGIEDSSYFGNSGGTPYINDGYAEYNMDSVKVCIDYFDVDFGDSKNAVIVNRILGPTSAYEFNGAKKAGYDLSDITQKVKSTDTGAKYLGSGHVSSNRIVARITFKIKLQVPFKSGILQWARYLESKNNNFVFGEPENHFGIRGLSEYTGEVDITDTEEDGIWYQYTTYRSVSR